MLGLSVFENNIFSCIGLKVCGCGIDGGLMAVGGRCCWCRHGDVCMYVRAVDQEIIKMRKMCAWLVCLDANFEQS